MDENQKTVVAAPEGADASAASAEKWTEKLRYSKSFTAKLTLSEQHVKEYYAAIATKLLSYEKVRSHVGWAGITFSAGRAQIARFVIQGKTLCLYLALEPETVSEGRYHAKDVSDKRKYEKTPSLFKIKSEGAARHAIRRIEELAQLLGLAERADPLSPILAKHFPTDSFNNLLTRGLIRLLKDKRRVDGADATSPEGQGSITEDEEAENPSEEMLGTADEEPEGVYDDTVKTVDDLVSRYAVYGEILEALNSGDATVRLSKKVMLRSIDEIWVQTVEDCLIALDELIRKPSRFIEETEEVLPIELTKKITSRSIQHLSQHTDYISKVEGDTVTPQKILNVFRDDSIMTYENKFLNTLLYRLYIFVNRRYEIGLKAGSDERVTTLDFSDTFMHGEMRGKINISVELSEKTEGRQDVRNTVYESGLWKRVEHLNSVVAGYMNSEFVRQMGKTYIRPPVMRTNAILKNKYFRQCLALWEFIESYDDSGYGLVINEQLENVSEAHIRQLYSGAAMQYLLFRHNVRGDYDAENAVTALLSRMFNPRIIEEPEPDTPEEHNFTFKNKEEAEEEDILFALDVALRADEQYEAAAAEASQTEEDEEQEEPVFGGIRYSKSFLAKLILSEDTLKRYFAEIGNELLQYKKVKMRTGWQYASFNAGRTQLAKVTIKGKTLYLYLALDPTALPEKYFIRDESGVKRYAQVPALLRVRSERGLKYAKELITLLAQQYGLPVAKKPSEVLDSANYPTETPEQLIARGLIRVSGGADITDESLVFDLQAKTERQNPAPDAGEQPAEKTAEQTTAAEKAPSSAAQEEPTVGQTAEETHSAAEAAEQPKMLTAAPDAAEQPAEKTAEQTTAAENTQPSAVPADDLVAAWDDPTDEGDEAEEPEREEDEGDEMTVGGVRYHWAFVAKLQVADDRLKHYFVDIGNRLLQYDKVKLRISWRYAAYHVGHTQLAKVGIKGKTLYFYLALDPAALPEKYFVHDESHIKRYVDTPARIRVRSGRGLKHARELVELLAEQYGLLPAKKPSATLTCDLYPTETLEVLMQRNLVRASPLRSASAQENGSDGNASEKTDLSGEMPAFQDELAPRHGMAAAPAASQGYEAPAAIKEDGTSAQMKDGATSAQPAQANDISDGDLASEGGIPLQDSVPPPAPAWGYAGTPSGHTEELAARISLQSQDTPATGGRIAPAQGTVMGGPQANRGPANGYVTPAQGTYAIRTTVESQAAEAQAQPSDEKNDGFDISTIKRATDHDYSKPTNSGVDDVSGYMQDMEEMKRLQSEKPTKGGIFSRLYGKWKKNNKGDQ